MVAPGAAFRVDFPGGGLPFWGQAPPPAWHPNATAVCAADVYLALVFGQLLFSALYAYFLIKSCRHLHFPEEETESRRVASVSPRPGSPREPQGWLQTRALEWDALNPCSPPAGPWVSDMTFRCGS